MQRQHIPTNAFCLVLLKNSETLPLYQNYNTLHSDVDKPTLHLYFIRYMIARENENGLGLQLQPVLFSPVFSVRFRAPNRWAAPAWPTNRRSAPGCPTNGWGTPS